MTWINYAEQEPTEAGVYRWRVPSVACPGTMLTFFAKHRLRGNGHNPNKLSPEFDRWDGYNIHVPKATQWAPGHTAVPKNGRVAEHIEVDGLSPSPCPFCKKVPRWFGWHAASGGGVFVGSDPHLYNTWKLECCSWATTPNYRSPSELHDAREALLSAGRPSATLPASEARSDG